MPRKDHRLIEMPFAKAPRVEWHGNHRVKCDAVQTRVGETLSLNLRKDPREPHFPVVFQAVNHIANRTLAAGDCHGAQECKLLAATIRADEIGGHPVVGLRASFATRGLHALDSCRAIVAPIPPLLHPPSAMGAVSWKK
jgi:hypothetical protein